MNQPQILKEQHISKQIEITMTKIQMKSKFQRNPKILKELQIMNGPQTLKDDQI